MSTSHTTHEIGVEYPDGTQDWGTINWYGLLDTKAARKNFQEQYDLRMEMTGGEKGQIKFYKQTVKVVRSEPELLIESNEPDDENPVINPEPSPEPSPAAVEEEQS